MNTYFKYALANNYNLNAYPFGMLMPDRNGAVSGTDYRYGFNGQEQETEISNSNSHTSAEYWMYDSRLGRRWNLDPMAQKYPHQSPYCAFNNSPLYFNDPSGLEGEDEKKSTSFLIIGKKESKKDDEVIQNFIKSTNETNWQIIYADDADDAYNQIQAYKEKNKIEVKNVFFASHGDYDVASFKIGDRKYHMGNTSVKGQSSIKLKEKGVQKTFEKWQGLDIKGVVVIGGCHSGAVHNQGQMMVQTISTWMNETVIANQSWSSAYPDMNSKGWLFDNYDLSHLQNSDIPSGWNAEKGVWTNHWRSASKYSYGIAAIGKTTAAFPIQGGKASVMTLLGTFYLNTDGSGGFTPLIMFQYKLESDRKKFNANPTAAPYGWKK